MMDPWFTALRMLLHSVSVVVHMCYVCGMCGSLVCLVGAFNFIFSVVKWEFLFLMLCVFYRLILKKWQQKLRRWTSGLNGKFPMLCIPKRFSQRILATALLGEEGWVGGLQNMWVAEQFYLFFATVWLIISLIYNKRCKSVVSMSKKFQILMISLLE